MRPLAHISDIHFGRHQPAITQAVISDILSAKPDIIVNSGDFTQRARRRQYAAARDFMVKLPGPQICVPGNHDIGDNSTLEAGYAGEFNNDDLDFYAESFNAGQGQFQKDTTRTNRFLYDGRIHALYATYKQSFGAFGLQGGLRTEWGTIKSDLVTGDSSVSNSYFNLYPTLHLSHKLSSAAELQLSYSRRTNRPEGDQLNPFPEYRDPRNVSAGNPYLQPEYIQAIELGCQFQTDQISILPALYYRYTYHRFTQITRAVDDSTLLTTRQNLANDQSGGWK